MCHRILLVATVLSIFCFGRAAALDFDKLAWRQPTAIDTLRDRLRVAEYEEKWDLATALVTEILSQSPRDGFALTEFALVCWNSGKWPDANHALEIGTMPQPDGIRLGRPEQEFLLGMMKYYQDDRTGAIEHLDRAVQLSPDWTWPRVRRALAKRETCAPWHDYEQDFQAGLEDADTSPKTLALLLDPGDLDWPGTTRAMAEVLAPRLATIPYTSEIPDYLRVFRSLEDARPSAADYDRILQELQQRHGSRSRNLVATLIGKIRIDLPPAAVRDLLDRRIAPTHPSLWRYHYADLLNELGWFERAESLLACVAKPQDRELAVLLLSGKTRTPADSLAARARRLLSMSLHPYPTDLARQALEDLGLKEEADAAHARSLAANPGSVLDDRFNVLISTNVNRASILLDSLVALEAAQDFSDWVPASIAEVRGDTAAVEAHIATLPRHAVPGTLAYLSGLASGTGDPARARRLSLRAVELGGNDISLVDREFQRAFRAEDMATAAQLLARLEALVPDCPTTIFARMDLRMARGEKPAMAADVRHTLARPDFTPELGMALAVYTNALGETALADSCLARAQALAPNAPSVRFMGASLQVQRRELEPARTALERLVREFPGRQSYRTSLLEAGGNAQKLPDLVTREEQRSGLEDFAYDLLSVDWIQARRVDPNSARGQSAIILQSRASYLATQEERCEVRQRLVVQILSEEAIDSFQPYRIAFATRQGAPRIRLARVIQPDGRVSMVPPSDIVISAMADDEADISDVLQTGIPFADLAVGSVLDLVFDTSYESTIATGWSWRHQFAESFPVREGILEVRRRKEFTLFQGSRMPEPVSTTDPPYISSMWRISDLPAMETEIEEFEPNPVGDMPWVGCSSYKSWEAASQNYSDTFWRRAVLSDSLRGVVRALSRGTRSPHETLQRLYTHLTDRVQYVAIELDRGAVIPTPADEVWRRGYGDCKDMVALLLAMLQEVGIEAQPVLVVPYPDPPIDREFVEVHRFTHVIAWVPGVDRGTFCDPTSGAKLADERGPGYCGRLGLGLPKGKRPGLLEVPFPSADRLGFALEYDIEPHSDRVAEIRVQGVFRGHFATAVRVAVAVADTSSVGATIDRLLGYGLQNWTRRQFWKVETDDLQSIVLSAVYRDTAWTAHGEKSVTLRLATEISDPYFTYPSAKGRKKAVLLPYSFRNRVVVRLQPGADWLPSAELATASIRGNTYSGRLEIRSPKNAATEPVEIVQEFEVRERRIAVGEFAAYRADWERFVALAGQPYRFRKRIRTEEVARLENYARAHPDDHGFAIEAAQAVLGADVGGEGEVGGERRRIATRILMPAARQTDAGSTPCLWLARIEAKEGRYLVADSLYVEALRRDPANVYCVARCAASKQEVGDWEQEVELLKKLVKMTGDNEPLLILLGKLYALDRTQEAAAYEERYFALGGDADSSKVLAAKLNALGGADRCERAAPLLPLLGKRVPKQEFRGFELSYSMSCDAWPRAAEILEELHAEDPIAAMTCNNLAWAYALLGRNLERAEELARTAAILADDPSIAQNTLGAVLARRGRWEEARGIFQEVYDSDDRPPNRAVNAYLIGLCDYQLGHKQSAVERWRQTLGLRVQPRWRRYIEESLELANEGGDVTRSLFMADTAEP